MNDDLRWELENEKIVKTGHFRLTSGRHSDTYIQKDMILHYPNITNNICYAMYKKMVTISDVARPIITAPIMGAVSIASMIARQANLPFVYPEKIDTHLEFRRGFDKFIHGRNVIIIEDIITTGGSVLKLIDAVEECNGHVQAVVCIWNRQGFKPKDEIRFLPVIDQRVLSYKDKDDCPYCIKGMPLTDPKTEKIIEEPK